MIRFQTLGLIGIAAALELAAPHVWAQSQPQSQTPDSVLSNLLNSAATPAAPSGQPNPAAGGGPGSPAPQSYEVQQAQLKAKHEQERKDRIEKQEARKKELAAKKADRLAKREARKKAAEERKAKRDAKMHAFGQQNTTGSASGSNGSTNTPSSTTSP